MKCNIEGDEEVNQERERERDLPPPPPPPRSQNHPKSDSGPKYSLMVSPKEGLSRVAIMAGTRVGMRGIGDRLTRRDEKEEERVEGHNGEG